jgi:putative oxidoreductase
MSDAILARTRATSLPVQWLLKLRICLEAVPYSVLAVPLRLGVAWIFWNSAQVKLINWERAVQQFADEFRVPLLPPDVAAGMTLVIELACPVLLVLGLFTRFAVVVLMGMTLVIQIFVFPEAWPTHLQWFAMMFVLLCRGAGAFSIDHLLWRRFGPHGSFGVPGHEPAARINPP